MGDWSGLVTFLVLHFGFIVNFLNLKLLCMDMKFQCPQQRQMWRWKFQPMTTINTNAGPTKMMNVNRRVVSQWKQCPVTTIGWWPQCWWSNKLPLVLEACPHGLAYERARYFLVECTFYLYLNENPWKLGTDKYNEGTPFNHLHELVYLCYYSYNDWHFTEYIQPSI